MGIDLSNYVDVATRIREFREKHPEGSLQPLNLDRPYDVLEIAGTTYVVYVAAAYRSPDDPRPGVGTAYEQIPGTTPYTKGSELQNAETSAWGRAIVAVLASDTRKGVASADEVQARSGEYEAWDPEPSTITAADIGGLAPSALGQELRARGLKSDGTVDAMRERLRGALV